MKKLITLLTISFFAVTTSILAQITLTPYLASEQIETARQNAATKLTDPIFIGLATINGTLPGLEVLGQPIIMVISIGDDADKGKATGWAYLFNSTSDPQNIQAIVVGKAPIGPTPLNLADLGVNFDFVKPYISGKKMDAVTWINSDVMIGKLKACDLYTNFMTKNPNGAPKLIILGYDNTMTLDPNTPYWFVEMHADADSTVIIIDAITGEVLPTTSVAEINTVYSSLKAFPNPAIGDVNIELTSEFANQLLNISIYDINGTKVNSFDQMANNSIVNINSSNLSNGIYSVRIIKGTKLMTSKFIINK